MASKQTLRQPKKKLLRPKIETKGTVKLKPEQEGRKMNNSESLKIKVQIALAVLAMSLSACAKDNSPSSSSNHTTKYSAPAGDDSFESYYNHFLFKPLPCSGSKIRWYQQASSSDIAMLTSNPELFFSMRLFLLPNNSYSAEIQLLKPRPDISNYTSEVLKTYEQGGKWSVVDNAIVLENLGVGHVLTYNGHRAINLDLANVASGALFNQSNTVLTIAESDSAPQQLEVQCR